MGCVINDKNTREETDVAFVHELQRNDRIIHLDRGHRAADDITPNDMGDSVGHWEGDTLVVDTIGLSPKTTFDMLGAPHTDQLHLVEHIRLLTPDQWVGGPHHHRRSGDLPPSVD